MYCEQSIHKYIYYQEPKKKDKLDLIKNFKAFVVQEIASRKWEDNPQNRRKWHGTYIQNI